MWDDVHLVTKDFSGLKLLVSAAVRAMTFLKATGGVPQITNI
jgi:hypothetical protein